MELSMAPVNSVNGQRLLKKKSTPRNWNKEQMTIYIKPMYLNGISCGLLFKF